jgi:hypothetical protein
VKGSDSTEAESKLSTLSAILKEDPQPVSALVVVEGHPFTINEVVPAMFFGETFAATLLIFGSRCNGVV